MSTEPLDLRAELLSVTRKLSEHLQWLQRGGIDGVPVAVPRVGKPRVAKTPLSAPAAAAAPVAAPARAAGVSGADALRVIREDLGECTRCKLSDGRSNIVYGVGNPEASLVFVGEAPGADEDRTGEPFVGAAGQLLTKMIEAMGFAREDVYICNIIKCRPPGNRNPEPDEIASCEPFLKAQLDAIRPRMIVGLGKFAVQTLLRKEVPISKVRGAWQTYEGIPMMPTFHPAFLLSNPSAKREVWADLKLVMGELDRLGVERPRVK